MSDEGNGGHSDELGDVRQVRLNARVIEHDRDANLVLVEFVGGPFDGQRHWIPGDVEIDVPDEAT